MDDQIDEEWMGDQIDEEWMDDRQKDKVNKLKEQLCCIKFAIFKMILCSFYKEYSS